MPDLSKYILHLSSSLNTWASPCSSCGHRAMQGCDRRRRNLWPHLHDTPEKHCHFFYFSAITCYPSDTSVKVSTKQNKPLSEPCGNSPNNFKQGPKLNIKPQSFGVPKSSVSVIYCNLANHPKTQASKQQLMASHNSEVTSSIPCGVGQGPSHSYIYLVAEQELDHPRKPHSYSQELVLTVSWTTQVFSMRHLSPHGDSSSRASPPWFFSPAGWPGFPYIVAAGIQKSKSKTATPSKLGPELAQHHFFVFGILLVRTSHKASSTQGGWGFGRQAATLVGVACDTQEKEELLCSYFGRLSTTP